MATREQQRGCDHEVGYTVCDGKGDAMYQVCKHCGVSLSVHYRGPSAVLAIARSLDPQRHEARR
jgi:hypothetical protein